MACGEVDDGLLELAEEAWGGERPGGEIPAPDATAFVAGDEGALGGGRGGERGVSWWEAKPGSMVSVRLDEPCASGVDDKGALGVGEPKDGNWGLGEGFLKAGLLV